MTIDNVFHSMVYPILKLTIMKKINNTVYLNLLLLLSSYAISSPLLFKNGFETQRGSIEFITNQSFIFSSPNEVANLEVLVKDFNGNIVVDGDIQWSLSSTINTELDSF